MKAIVAQFQFSTIGGHVTRSTSPFDKSGEFGRRTPRRNGDRRVKNLTDRSEYFDLPDLSPNLWKYT